MSNRDKFPNNGFKGGDSKVPEATIRDRVDGETVKIGYINNNWQVCLGTRGMRGNDSNAKSYAMFCLCCGHIYGSNGTDIAGAGAGKGRYCHKCQGGEDGIPF